MRRFFAETRKAWAAAAGALSTGWATASLDGHVTGVEAGTIGVAIVVAWVLAWAVPNRDRRPPRQIVRRGQPVADNDPATTDQ